jgi:hypothetical protein
MHGSNIYSIFRQMSKLLYRGAERHVPEQRVARHVRVYRRFSDVPQQGGRGRDARGRLVVWLRGEGRRRGVVLEARER